MRDTWADTERNHHMTTKRIRFTQLARSNPQLRCTALMGLLTEPQGLHASFHRQDGRKAVGADGVRKGDYEQGLDERIAALSATLRRGGYRPTPVRRVHIPKGDGRTRPLGIPSFEDRLVQDQLSWILQAIWEPTFCECSYGFRPGRSAHDALKRVGEIVKWEGTQWVVEADIKGFFDNVDHEHLMRFLAHRIADPNLMRIVRRFLKAGHLEDGQLHASERGTPQGGLVSPVLANIYLHYVLDLWFEKRYARGCAGQARLVRYADDFIACFETEDDARRFLPALTERLASFSLELAAEKTRLVRFGTYSRQAPRTPDVARTFYFLGFTHYMARSLRGGVRVGRRTERKRFSRKLTALNERLGRLRVDGGREMQRYLWQHLTGHIQYYGVSGNAPRLHRYIEQAQQLLFKWLNRRSQRRSLTWEEYRARVGCQMPRARIVHNLYTSPRWMPRTGSRMV